MQSDNPPPHSLKEYSYAIALAGGLAILNAIIGLVITGFWFLVNRGSRVADANHTRADTDHLRAETQHVRLQTADEAIERFWQFQRRLEALSEELESMKPKAQRTEALEAEVQVLTAWNKKMQALCTLHGIQIPKP